MKNQDLRNFFLIDKINNGIVEFCNNEIGIGFELNHYPYGLSSETHQENVINWLTKQQRLMPNGAWFQKQDFFYKQQVKTDKERHYSAISIEDQKFYSDRKSLSHKSYVYLIFTPSEFRDYTLNDSPFVRMVKMITNPNRKIGSDIEAQLNAFKETFSNEQIGFTGKVMSTESWQKVLYAYYTGMYEVLEEELPSELDLGSYYLNDNGYLQREEKLFATVYLGREPEQPIFLNDKWKTQVGDDEKLIYHPNNDMSCYSAYPINGGLPFEHVTTVSIQRTGNEKTINALKRERSLNSFGTSKTGDGSKLEKANIEIEESTAEHTGVLIDQIAKGSVPSCSYGVSVTVPATDNEQMGARILKVKNAFAQYSAKGEYNKAHNMPAFFTAAPGHAHNGHDLFYSRVVNALPFVNINTYTKTGTQGISFKDPFSGANINIDLWDDELLAQVRNGYYDGPTRGGKSVLVAKEIDYYNAHLFHQVIIEKGESYLNLTLLYNGDYIKLSPNGDYGIDLFDYDPRRISELHKSIMVNVFAMMYPKAEETIYEGLGTLIANYNEYCTIGGIKPHIESFEEYYNKDFKHIETRFKEYIDLELFSEQLEKFVRGENKWLFNNTNNISINHKRFVVFELKELESSPLFNMAMEAILGVINRKMEYWDRKIRLVIKVDEAVQPFRTDRGGKLLGDFYTQVGKFNAGISLMVQSIKMLTNLPAWEAVTSNTQYRWFTYNAHLDGWAESQAEELGWDSYRLNLLKSLRTHKYGREHLLIMGGQEKIADNPKMNIRELLFNEYYKNFR
jgi:hypothetical protein